MQDKCNFNHEGNNSKKVSSGYNYNLTTYRSKSRRGCFNRNSAEKDFKLIVIKVGVMRRNNMLETTAKGLIKHNTKRGLKCKLMNPQNTFMLIIKFDVILF